MPKKNIKKSYVLTIRLNEQERISLEQKCLDLSVTKATLMRVALQRILKTKGTNIVT